MSPLPGGEVQWKDVRAELERWVGKAKSLRAAATEIGLTHGALSMLIGGQSSEPYPANRAKIERWIDQNRVSIGEPPMFRTLIMTQADYDTYKRQLGNASFVRERQKTPDEEFLDYLLKNFEQTATFMQTATEDLSPQDRKRVAFAILSGLKKMAIEMGEPVPDALFEIEKRYLSEQ